MGGTSLPAFAVAETDDSSAAFRSPSTPMHIEDQLPESIERLRAGSAALGRRMRGLEDLLVDALQQCGSPIQAQTPNPPGTTSPQQGDSLELARTLHEMRQIVAEIGEQQIAQDNLTAVCAAQISGHQNESHCGDTSTVEDNNEMD